MYVLECEEQRRRSAYASAQAGLLICSSQLSRGKLQIAQYLQVADVYMYYMT